MNLVKNSNENQKIGMITKSINNYYPNYINYFCRGKLHKI